MGKSHVWILVGMSFVSFCTGVFYANEEGTDNFDVYATTKEDCVAPDTSGQEAVVVAESAVNEHYVIFISKFDNDDWQIIRVHNDVPCKVAEGYEIRATKD